MKKRIFLWMVIQFLLTVLPSMVLAQDPGIADTVRFNSGNLLAYPGQACIPIYFTADEPVSGPNDSIVAMLLPFRWHPIAPNCDTFFLDSVSWVHSESRIRDGYHMVTIDNQSQFVGIYTYFNGLDPTVNGTICELWFSYPPEESCSQLIDTTRWPPVGEPLGFATKDARKFTPQFVKGLFHLSNDPGIPDTVRLDGGELPVWAGRALIPVRFTTDEWLA